MNTTLSSFVRNGIVLLLAIGGTGALKAADWPDWRGPARNGVSPDKGLPEKWSPQGENLSWKAPFGGRSGPVVFGDRLYMVTPGGKGETLQERLVCLNADTGKPLWEHRVNLYHSDVPPHRIAWASPAVDPQTGNVFMFTVAGSLISLTNQGKVLWERSMSEDFGLITTHGGRTVSPMVEEDLVVVSSVMASWGTLSRGAHRFIAFDKNTGQTVWVSSPEGRPTDTIYSPLVPALINGVKQIVSGGSDGAMHALKLLTGEPVWKFPMSKRGLNTGAVFDGTTAYVSHSEENLGTSEMGLLAAIDASAGGELGKNHVRWSVPGFQGGFSSPVLDGNRLYQVDNGAVLHAFDSAGGKALWRLNLGTIQRASPVLADGKLYVGTENGKFFILRPGAERCEILDEDFLGNPEDPEEIIGSAAVSGGRVFMVTTENLYCIGAKSSRGSPAPASPPAGAGSGPPVRLQVAPTEVILRPGEALQFSARLYDAQGRRLPDQTASWSLEQLQGSVDASGRYAAPPGSPALAGSVKATLGGLSGSARLRVLPPLPWNEDFESYAPDSVPLHWVNATGKYAVRDLEGNKVLVKLPTNLPFVRRARTIIGPQDWSNYTVQADVRAIERRRQMGDGGVVAQRYSLILFGAHQRVKLEAWQPETERTVQVPFAWKGDTWYRMKLEVQNLPGGKVRARGKVWSAAEAEPQDWLVERIDPIGNTRGSSGLYGDAPFDIYYDNLKITANK